MSEILYKCTIPGRARILKNSKKLVRNKKTGRMFPISSDRYQKWEVYASMYIKRAAGNIKTIDFPVVLTCRFYFKNHAHEPDLSNCYQGIEDILQKCSVIENDKLIYSHDGSQKVFTEETERVEIEIKRL